MGAPIIQSTAFQTDAFVTFAKDLDLAHKILRLIRITTWIKKNSKDTEFPIYL